jgi:hypothetical protein
VPHFLDYAIQDCKACVSINDGPAVDEFRFPHQDLVDRLLP